MERSAWRLAALALLPNLFSCGGTSSRDCAITPPPTAHPVELSWTISSSPDITAYNVYRSMAQGGPYSILKTAITEKKYTDADITTNTTYYYVVTAFDTQGQESAFSNEDMVYIP